MLTRQHPLVRTRCALLGVAATAGAAVLGRALGDGLARPVGSVDEALVRTCLAALLGAVVWAWLATLSVVAEAWRGRPVRRAAAAPLRRVLLLCCGVVLTAPVGAAAGDEHPAPGPEIAGLPFPDRTAGPGHTSRQPTHRVPRTVVVRAGDCLWRLAAAELPAGASAARVTAYWRAIHHRNAAVIGRDPDLIHPGQRLVLPPAEISEEPP